jgi:hypothetical protein
MNEKLTMVPRQQTAVRVYELISWGNTFIAATVPV